VWNGKVLEQRTSAREPIERTAPKAGSGTSGSRPPRAFGKDSPADRRAFQKTLLDPKKRHGASGSRHQTASAREASERGKTYGQSYPSPARARWRGHCSTNARARPEEGALRKRSHIMGAALRPLKPTRSRNVSRNNQQQNNQQKIDTIGSGGCARCKCTPTHDTNADTNARHERTTQTGSAPRASRFRENDARGGAKNYAPEQAVQEQLDHVRTSRK